MIKEFDGYRMNQGAYSDLLNYLRILLLRKKIVILTTLVVMTAGILLSYVLPKKYEAAATVFIEQSVISDLVKGIAVTPSVDAKIKVLTVSMLSRSTLSRVIRALDRDVMFKTDSSLEEYMDTLRKQINIKLDEKKGVFFISFIDPDPKFAQEFVNMLTQVYIESNTSSKRQESLEATRFLGEQIDSFKKRLDSVDAEINAYKAEHGMQLAVDDTIIRFEIADAEKKIEAILARRFELEAQDKLLPAGGGGGKSGSLADLERQLAGMRSVYTDSHPKMVRLKGEIAALRANPEPVGDGGKTSMAKGMIKAELQANKIQEETQLKMIEDKKQLLREIPTIRAGLNDLQRKKDNEMQIYSQLVTRYGQSEVSKQMEMENKSVSFRVVDPAVYPEKHVSPKRPLIMLGGLVCGLGLGIAVVLLPYILRGSIKNASQLKELNLRVLVSIPLIPKLSNESQNKRTEYVFLAAAGVYFLILLAVCALEILDEPYLEVLVQKIARQFV